MKYAYRILIIIALALLAALAQEPGRREGDKEKDVSFSSDILPIFAKAGKCTLCHRGDNPSGLDLSPDKAYKNLVKVKSRQDPESFLVLPGEVEKSYLYQKLIGPGKEGTIMPPSGKLPDELLDKVSLWIKQGAKDN